LDRPTQLDAPYINRKVILPYNLTVDEVAIAVAETYRLFHGLNDFLTSGGFRPLEELLLGNSLSGIISEFLVKNIARASAALEANLKVGGHPDLLPKGHYTSNLILKGDEGIEVKASIQRGGWQGHNPASCIESLASVLANTVQSLLNRDHGLNKLGWYGLVLSTRVVVPLPFSLTINAASCGIAVTAI
jgi:hypothetical protein